MKSGYANEMLLHCLCGKPVASKFEQLSESDWNAVVHQAGRHNVTSLLYRSLSAPHLESAVPSSIIQTLRIIYLEFAWKNTRLYNDLSKILKTLQQKNIPVILLKGAHLAQIVYGNIALRPMCDIDILVKKNDLPKAKKLLLGLGYSRVRLKVRFLTPYTAFFILFQCVFQYPSARSTLRESIIRAFSGFHHAPAIFRRS